MLFSLPEEDELAGFLGIHVEHTADHVKLTLKGLTQRVIEALQIKDLPPVDKVIGKDPEGDPPDCAFIYASVIGMLWHSHSHS